MYLYNTHVVKRNLKTGIKNKKYILKKGSYGRPNVKPTVVGPAVVRPLATRT